MKQKIITTDEIGYKLRFGQKLYRGIKLFTDSLLALVGLIVLFPLFIITAIAIKIDSRGPVFFYQKRIGFKGKEFKCIKFRSMAVEANHSIAGYEYADAKFYITKVGRFIRKFSIDELPQLFNVFIGQMSLVGFRPSQRNERELNDARESYNMYQIRPGISGWAQVNGRDYLASQPVKKAQFDNYYLHHFSFFMDIKILFLTFIKVFGCSDVEEGKIKDIKTSYETDCSNLSSEKILREMEGGHYKKFRKNNTEDKAN